MPSSNKVTMTIKCETTREHLREYANNMSGLPSSNELNNILAAIKDDEGALDSIRVKYEDVYQGPNPNFLTVKQIMAALAVMNPDARVEIWQMDPGPDSPPFSPAEQSEPQYVDGIAPVVMEDRNADGIVMVYVR